MMQCARDAPIALHRYPRCCIGTSGWSYDFWAEDFFKGIPRRAWLAHYATRFNSVEVNGTFYHQFPRKAFERWHAETPDDFRFAIKGHRYLTHVLKLAVPADVLERQRDAAAGLGNKLAAVVWQLPDNLSCELDRLSSFVQQLRAWPEVRHAIEFRHESWFVDAVAQCLESHHIAVCQSDAADWPLWNAVTTDAVYVRLHGREVTYVSPYSNSELSRWAERGQHWLADGRTVYMYFDNTDVGCAPRDALKLKNKIAKRLKPAHNAAISACGLAG